ncbi:SDR family NAD(P)-dependent oxidoreductase [Cupriavidus sp. CV2]|uniref:SDR family NAD(P)-dependent oxidoreductase n=1 Tax=Cupriavidus ulmosensis TaxID=3065913 RepID=UPI00296AE815|nr:SDR family NAD(P)-dependent oxidoreductase [Cupriavidus sp. CV2]MDW3682139.1 SDR family NAD(P)-dependent oxidoreductase [Cupriavidus sp. CV2]
MSSFKDKVAIVTGGAGGLGRVEARLFAEQGAFVAICDVAADGGEQLAAELRDRGLQARYFTLDVTSQASWDAVIADVLRWQGRIGILVNNAGILCRKTIASYSEAEWRRVLDVNLTGTFLGISRVAPHMCTRRGGAIVNIASNAALSGHADPAYTASKWGVRGLTKSAALEFAASGVRVNCVCPGLVITDINRHSEHLKPMIAMVPMGRAVEADEIASVVAFLAGDGSGMITGEEIVVDGGFTAGAAYWKVSTDAGLYGAAK